MKLIALFGPPAVGKLTVAKVVVEKTGYKILHLHMTIDLVTALFDRTTDTYTRLNRTIRLELIKAAAQDELPGLIFTYGYGHPTADDFVKDLINLCKTYSVDLHFVYLTCSQEELLKRVIQPSRKGTGKIQSTGVLLEALSKRNFGQISYVDSLVINNTNLSPESVADQIVEEFGLPTQS